MLNQALAQSGKSILCSTHLLPQEFSKEDEEKLVLCAGYARFQQLAKRLGRAEFLLKLLRTHP